MGIVKFEIPENSRLKSCFQRHSHRDSFSYSLSGVKLEGSLKGPVVYDENPTPMQELIERVVTRGRGYLSLLEAMEVVNQSELKLSLGEVFASGIVPINFGVQKQFYPNPCNERIVGETQKFWVSPLYTPPTLVERLRREQYLKAKRAFKERIG